MALVTPMSRWRRSSIATGFDTLRGLAPGQLMHRPISSVPGAGAAHAH